MADSTPPAPDGKAAASPQAGGARGFMPAPAPGSILFRRYRVIRELGRGGMGVVMLAYDTALDIDVALKLVPEMVVKDAEAIADLRQEVLRGMALAHPSIVRTHNFEKDDSGAGIVMEYVEGENLADLKTHQPERCFDVAQIVDWVEQICTALEYAYREVRIVHRDLKPRNIMITRSGRAKVADFGIAAVVSDSMSRYSNEGKISGTLGYMSPQQAQGRRPSHLDDIHSIGAIIYELLTGKPPFFRGNPLMIQTQVLTVTPPSMTERRMELEVLNKGMVPLEWESTVAACLAKEPEDRPASTGEIWRRLCTPPPSPDPDPDLEAFTELETETRPAFQSTAPMEMSDRRAMPWAVAMIGLGAIVAIIAVFASRSSQRSSSSSTTPAPVVTPEATPTPMPVATPAPSPTPAPVVNELVNSLGMKLIRVPGVEGLVSVWETRVKDYAAYADSTHVAWEQTTFPQKDLHPAVNVSWEDARAFCAWLSEKEGRRYRLPTDEEWSTLAGLPSEPEGTPRDKSGRASGYGWGQEWPPDDGAGNYADLTARDENPELPIIEDYDDGVPYTAPVGSFPPNRAGLYDVSGNAAEWCEDRYNPGASRDEARVIRGGSWIDHDRRHLRLSDRYYDDPMQRRDFVGFRCVLELHPQAQP